MQVIYSTEDKLERQKYSSMQMIEEAIKNAAGQIVINGVEAEFNRRS